MEEKPDEANVEDEDSADTEDVEIEDSIEEKEDSAVELQERLLRLQAEFDNYRKRMEARFSDVTRFASEGILLKVLEILDNLQRALEVDYSADPKGAKEGVQAIERQVTKILSQEEVRPIESVGKIFDPYYQHAISKTNDPEQPDGLVVQEFQRGYMIREKVLRPALVIVNRHEQPPAEEMEVDVEIEDEDHDNSGEE